MSLKLRFNLILILTLTIGASLSGYLTFKQLKEDAYSEVISMARFMLDSALSVRRYTIEQVRPNLDPVKINESFLPQSVPAYGATEVVNYIKEQRPEYSYKEAVLNPTNMRDLAVGWERQIIEDFKVQPGIEETIGFRKLTSGGEVLYLARPIIIKNEACLACHDTPERAPASMLKRYGHENGFGWRLNEIIGAQIVQVPSQLPFSKAKKSFTTFIAWLVGIFMLSLVFLNILLHFNINKRIETLTNFADSVSRGQLKENIVITGSDELATLGKAIARMERSHAKSLDIIRSQAMALKKKDSKSEQPKNQDEP